MLDCWVRKVVYYGYWFDLSDVCGGCVIVVGECCVSVWIGYGVYVLC